MNSNGIRIVWDVINEKNIHIKPDNGGGKSITLSPDGTYKYR